MHRSSPPVHLCLGLIILLCAPAPSLAQGDDLGPAHLIVTTREAPPFAMQAEDGSWQGISIEFWEQIARELHPQYEYRELPLGEMLQGVA